MSTYLGFPLDDSYTPATIGVHAGTGPMDLHVSLDKPDTFDSSAELNEDNEGLFVSDCLLLTSTTHHNV